MRFQDVDSGRGGTIILGYVKGMMFCWLMVFHFMITLYPYLCFNYPSSETRHLVIITFSYRDNLSNISSTTVTWQLWSHLYKISSWYSFYIFDPSYIQNLKCDGYIISWHAGSPSEYLMMCTPDEFTFPLICFHLANL